MEQDPPGDDELPTYDDLAALNGPNSRFGRWKDWVEKRAAERYAEDTPERRLARRMRGWGDHVDMQSDERAPSPPPPPLLISPPSASGNGLRRTQTVLSSSSPPVCEPKSASYTTLGQALPPSHLRLHSFGSRFLPHSALPILTLLPLFNDTKLLIGHTNGLSVLDMHPDAPSSELGSQEPRRRDIWHGEGVYQLALLEYDQRSANGTPQGVILALVGAEPPEGGTEKESKEAHKVVRMYNLASLASITSWATTGKDYQPLNLSRPSNWEPQQSGARKSKAQLSISRGLRTFRAENAEADSPPPTPPPKDPPRSSPRSPATADLKARPGSAGSEWDVVGHDDLPLRWATDYIPLTSPGTRLATQSVLFFELHRCTDEGPIAARLAIVTKPSILLYESMRGERAFRFVKDFYTPLPARSVRFVYQGNQHLPAFESLVPLPESQSLARGPGQLSLFVVFEKKAGLIRVSDSSVGEIELWEGGASPKSAFRRSISSLEGLTSRDWRGAWAPPAAAALPGMPVYLLTRGKRTHVLPAPLPMRVAAQAPLQVLNWGMQPTQVVPRACERPATGEPFLQVTALSEDGVEVQELPLASLAARKGKQRARDDTVVAQAEVGPGGAGFLCMGGHWTELDAGRTDVSPAEQGFYAWTRQGYEDWRVFWLGGAASDDVPPGSP